MDALLRIFKELSAYLAEYKVVSEDELLLKIEESINMLRREEVEEIEKRFEGNLKELIFKSLTTHDKLSIFSPDIHVKINYQGEIFYCPPSHRYMSKEIEEAFLRLAKIRNPLKEIKRVVEGFMERCGYQTSVISDGDEYMEMVADKMGKKLRIFLFPSIKFTPPFFDKYKEEEKGKGEEEKVVVVPTEKTPMPFISFFREQDAGDFMIWVADIKKNTIDPFIGNPEDEEIERNFNNPEQARRAVATWMRKMPLLNPDF
ncbi:MAG: DUF6834 family protein [Candidatus Methanospirareceae archaeon]